jgi:quaternary ammonium compound-resistance protein SugE
MGWIYLILAGILEIGFATSLKMSDGFTKLWPTVAFVFFSILSLWFLTLSMKSIPVGTAYSIWTGIGVFGTSVLGVLFFGDPIGFGRIFFLGMLLISIIGLKCMSGSSF